ncbi:MAG: hypothetical protein IH898_08370, partial [Planctomycetes bacterium]|nr:hypothetical protein [Planctomycetota bacterium]
HLYLSTNDCERCHSEPFERDKADGTLDRVRLLEWVIWKDQDKHSWAYRVLHEARGQRIGELMDQDVLDASTGCVQCHTSNVIEQLWSPAILKNNLQNDYMAEGVSCQSCHGPAEDWVLEHQKDNWLQRNHDEKASFGLNKMEDPVHRAEMCLSCHQGNADLGRVITHEMYAAGHPTLSGFEMEGFADKMPRHWRFSHEKPNGGPPKFDRTRAVLLGSVVALRMAVVQAAGEGDNWPELARLECYSCHHQLRTPTWRQAPGRVELPGRPRLQLGCLPLVRAAAVFIHGPAGEDQFADLVRRTQQPFQHNVFGDPAELAALQQGVSRWCADLERQLQSRRLEVEQTRAILRGLITSATEEAYDFDTSRQLSGAMAVICEELSQASVDMPNLATLRIQLNKIRYDVFELSPQEEKRVEQRYPVVLSRRARYKPEKFTQLMVRFRDQLSE